MNIVYIVIHETSISGTYATPKEACMATWGFEISREEKNCENETERMLKPHADYPYIKKLVAGEKWSMDR